MADEQLEGAGAGAVAETTEESLLDAITAQTKYAPSDGEYSVVKKGVEVLMRELLEPKHAGERVDKALVDGMIAEIDGKLSSQLDEILHHQDFQKIESAWRGLKMLVDRTNFRENIKIEILQCQKDELIEDFEDAPEIPKSGLYKKMYTEEYGQFGGEPLGAVVMNYSFGPGAQDVGLLQNVAAVGTMAHCPVVGAAGSEFFGIDDIHELPNLKDLSSIFEGPKYTKWRSFRESEDARSVALAMPRFLGRLPYGEDSQPVKSFNYSEKVTDDHDKYLWCNAAFAFATNLTRAFAANRWCANIIGPRGGGAVEDLPIHLFEEMGETTTKIPTEIMVSDRREFELAEEGFMPLVFRKGSDNACFFSANSCQKPKYFGQSKEAKENEANYRLGTMLPYMFMINRLAHYLKVLQRENLGRTQTKTKLQQELDTWIRQYVNDTDTPQEGTIGRRPLRRAQITVEDIEGEPGWYRVDLKIMPHFKYQGANFSLSLVSKMGDEAS
jgi:type VI secretion system protein ImpC